MAKVQPFSKNTNCLVKYFSAFLDLVKNDAIVVFSGGKCTSFFHSYKT